jgi:hypothetical protein
MFKTQLERDDSDIPEPEIPSRATILRRHFFRRFFDNDAIALEAETQSAVVRALCAVAVPTLMVAFWLLPHYPHPENWSTAADRYFFVMYPFMAMGIVTTFEWEMLFPDRADFLILLPMPLRSRELFYAKGKALLSFLGMFLAAANLFAIILYPAVSTLKTASYFHSFWSHLAAVTLSGACAAFAVLALEGLTMTLLPEAWFRFLSPAIQALLITASLLFLLLFPLFGGHMQPLLEGRAGFAIYVPPLWFLGLYEHLQLGANAPAGSATLATIGLFATAICAVAAAAIYPLAWARQKRRAIEGVARKRGRSRNLLAPALKFLMQRSQARALFHFVSQTIVRNNRYQVYLAIYAGAGFALALTSVSSMSLHRDGTLALAFSQPGLHAVLPLLLIWMVLGLKAAFAFPVDMAARWVFPVALRPRESYAGPYPGPDAKAARAWVLGCCLALTVLILALLAALHWSIWQLSVQAVTGACLCLLLTDAFFLGRTQIPFTRARMPGRQGLPMLLCTYAVAFPALVLCTVQLELSAELAGSRLVWIALWTSVILAALKLLDRLAERGIIGGFPEDEDDDGPLLLGLSQPG